MLGASLDDETDAVRTVDTLLSLGADVDAVDIFTSETALHGAEHVAVVQRLLDAGARPDIVSEQGLTPIAAAWSRVKSGPLQEFKRRFNYYTHRSLRAAVELHDFKVARNLLADGARLDLRDWATRQSVTIFLAHAVMEGRRDVVERFLTLEVSQCGPDTARSGAGLVNARVWIESAGCYMPLLHVAAYAGMEGAFTEVSPPNADSDDPIAAGYGGGGGGVGGGGGGGGRSGTPMRGGRGRGGGGGGVGRFGGDEDDSSPSERDRSPMRRGQHHDRAGDGGRMRYGDLDAGSSGVPRGGGGPNDDSDDAGGDLALGASASLRQLRAQLSVSTPSNGGRLGGGGGEYDDYTAGGGGGGGDDYRTPARGRTGGGGGYRDGGGFDSYSSSRGGGGGSRFGGLGASPRQRSPSPLGRGRFGRGGGGGLLSSTLEPVEDADEDGGDDDEEDEAALARRKYRRLVKALVSHGARFDAVIEWRLPAVARRKRRHMRRYGDDSDDEDDSAPHRRGGGGSGPGAGMRPLVGVLHNASALHVAAYFGRTGFVQEWIAGGGPLEAQAGGGASTPLAIAEMEDRPGVAQLLRTAGADTHPRSSDYLLLEDLRTAGGDPRELAATRRLVTSRLRRVLSDGLAAFRSRSAKDYDFSPVLDALFALNGDALLDAVLRGQTFNPQKDEDVRMACGALLGQAILGLRVDVLTALLQLDRAHNGLRGARSGGGIVNARLAFARPDAPKSAGLAVLTTPLHLLAEMSYSKREDGMKAGARSRHEAMVSELLRFRPNPRALAEPARVGQPYSMCPALTALHLFAVHDDVAAIRLWGEADVPVDLECADAGTPLHLSIRCGNVAAARALILAGADVSALCGRIPSPPVHRLVDFTLWVDEACTKLSAAAVEAAEASGAFAGEEAAAAAAHMRSVGARRVALLTRLMKRAGCNMSARSHAGRTVLGSILSRYMLSVQQGYLIHLIATAMMPRFLEDHRDAWHMGTSVPLFQARLSGDLALAAMAADRGGGGSPLGKKLWGDGGGGPGDHGEGASTVLDADSATFVSGDARTQAGGGSRVTGGGRGKLGGASRVLDAASAALDDLDIVAGGGAARGDGDGHNASGDDDDAAAHRDVPDSASVAGGGGDDESAVKLPATFTHRLDMVAAPGGGAGSGGGPSSPGVGRDALLGASGLRDGGDGAARGPSSPYAVAAAVGLTGAYDGDSGARDERDLVCELMPDGFNADAEMMVTQSLVYTLAIEVLNSLGPAGSDLWADGLQQCLVKLEMEPESLPPLPLPSRVDAYHLV